MVVSEQVEETVDEGPPPCVAHNLRADDDVPELARDAGRKRFARVDRKCEHVGRLVDAEVLAPEPAHLLGADAKLTLIALVLTVIVVIATKAWTGRGTPLRGGLPSGHAALAFAGWIAATYVIGGSHRFLISFLTFVMALLVAQTRIESGIHSALEVTYGGVLGALVTLGVFQLFS